MAKQTSENVVANAIGAGVAGLLILVLTPAWNVVADQLSRAIGPALMSFVLVVIVILITAFCFAAIRYSGILGAGGEPEVSPERQAYDKLRASLADGNTPARLYAKWLTIFLDWVERFFGDVGMADRTLFPHFFGLKTPASLWTAPAFDRCLLLALLYPIATIFIIWAISGHVGPAEAALGLPPDLPGWRRSLGVGAIGVAVFALWRIYRTAESESSVRGNITLSISGAVAGGAVAGTVAGAVAVVAAVAGARALGGAVALAVAVAVPVPVAFGLLKAGAILFGSSGVAGAGAVAFAGAVAGAAGVAGLSGSTIKHRLQGVFLSLFLPAMILACLAAGNLLSHLETWEIVGPLLLFLELLTLLNAPFDWASLGLTRALLRRGLELGGWWPYLLAFADAALALVIIALLALAMVIGVQAFDELAVHGGGKPVLPLDALFDGIAKNPAAPEYWWAYALLLSSMIPSFINLAFGGMALTRGIPGLPSVFINFMPTGKAVPGFDRAWMALVLTVQIFVGAFLGIAAQAFLAWALIFHAMPWIGLDLLDMARAVADFDLPMRVARLFAGTL